MIKQVSLFGSKRNILKIVWEFRDYSWLNMKKGWEKTFENSEHENQEGTANGRNSLKKFGNY